MIDSQYFGFDHTFSDKESSNMELDNSIAIYWAGGQFTAAKVMDVELIALPKFLEQLKQAELKSIAAAVEHAASEDDLGRLLNELIIVSPLHSPAQPLRFKDKASNALRLVPDLAEPWMKTFLTQVITLADEGDTEMSWEYLERAGGWLPKEIRSSPKFGLSSRLVHRWKVPENSPLSKFIRFD